LGQLVLNAGLVESLGTFKVLLGLVASHAAIQSIALGTGVLEGHLATAAGD